jgi:hypothetical protein
VAVPPSSATGYNSHAIVAGYHTIHADLIARGEYQDFRSSVLLKIEVCLAGPEAEAIVFGDCDARGDMHIIEELPAKRSASPFRRRCCSPPTK